MNKGQIIIDVEESIFKVLEGRMKLDGFLSRKETQQTVVHKLRDITENMLGEIGDILDCSTCEGKEDCPVFKSNDIIKAKAIATIHLVYTTILRKLFVTYEDMMLSPLAYLESYYDEFGEKTLMKIVMSEYAVQLIRKAKDSTCFSQSSMN